MKYNLKKEIPILAMVVLPFIYLGYLWNALPEKVPLHWNFKGEIDGWGNKDQLVLIILVLPVFVYIILQFIPLLDPKKKIEKMGNRFHQIKFLVVLTMSLLAIFILYTVQNQSGSNMKILFALIGFLIVGLGNYFPTLKPNYFIGIKTPWTLESETVWKETHKMGGRLWFFGGVFMILLVLVLPEELSFIVFMSGVALLTIVPVVFSYSRYKALKG